MAKPVGLCRRCWGPKEPRRIHLCSACARNPVHAKKPCNRCGGPKDRGRGSRYCEACQPIAEEEAINRSYNRDGRDAHLRRTYGITTQGYEAMLRAQNGKCAICGDPAMSCAGPHAAIDHNHNTGVVRGLLCGWCNSGIGYFRDQPERLEAAAAYLRDAA